MPRHTIQEHPKHLPAGLQWVPNDYAVMYWRNAGRSGHATCSTLTEARRVSAALIAEDSATTCEVYRYARAPGEWSTCPLIQATYRATV